MDNFRAMVKAISCDGKNYFLRLSRDIFKSAVLCVFIKKRKGKNLKTELPWSITNLEIALQRFVKQVHEDSGLHEVCQMIGVVIYRRSFKLIVT